jgi:competence protein ComEC
LVTLFLFGHQLATLRTHTNQAEHIIHLPANQKIMAFSGVIIDAVKETENSYKTTIQLDAVKMDSTWQQQTGKVLCYFAKDSANPLTYGNKVICKSSFSLVDTPKNPSEFNYKRYLSFHNIYHRAYIGKGKYVVSGAEPAFSFIGKPNYLIAQAISVRYFLVDLLSEHFSSNRELGIAEALILGVKDTLENDVVKAYSGVGAMHVLAVSGLHVGLVYQVFVLLFGWMKTKGWKMGKIAQPILLLLAVWLYAFITGLSPSVIRAATMFSFIILAQATGKSTNIYNTLAVSAFFLLCINPFLLMEVGFQLSYLAVLGIVYIQPKLYGIFSFNTMLIDKIWMITCVSVAAQVATFPLGLLYFHQFPTYFFISNLIVIPAAILILYGGIFVLIFSFSASVSSLLAIVLEKIIWATNELIFRINAFPYALISGVDISIAECWLIFAMIVLLLSFFHLKKLSYFAMAFVSSLFFSGLQLQEFITESNKQGAIVYAVPNHSAIALRNGREIYFFADSALYMNDDKMLFHIKHHWWNQNIDRVWWNDKSSIQHIEVDGNKLLVWNGKSFLYYRNPIKKRLQQPLHVDYFIVQDNVWIDKEKIELNFSFSQLIIDSSNNYKTRAYCIRHFSEAYDVLSEGAWIAHL